MTEVLIDIKQATKIYHGKDNQGKQTQTLALNDVNLTIFKGETLAVVGESGSGKSTLGKVILGLESLTSGEILFNQNMTKQVIFQDPFSALNPKMTALELVVEALIHENISLSEKRDRARHILKLVGISEQDSYKKPKAFSGGQRQRIGIARAVVSRPSFIVCDEPTSALDVSIQAQIITLLTNLKQELGLSYLFISHDLGVVEHLADRIAVFYRGHLVELATTEELFRNPQHLYTKKLLNANLSLNPHQAKEQLRLAMQMNHETIVLSQNSEWIKINEYHYVRREL